MTVEITGFNPKRYDKIVQALAGVWNFDPDDHAMNDTQDGRIVKICRTGEDNLCGGMMEEEFADDLAKAVFKANGRRCQIDVAAVCMEHLPCERYSYDRHTVFKRRRPA
jgi:hypothetical protein